MIYCRIIEWHPRIPVDPIDSIIPNPAKKKGVCGVFEDLGESFVPGYRHGNFLAEGADHIRLLVAVRVEEVPEDEIFSFPDYTDARLWKMWCENGRCLPVRIANSIYDPVILKNME